MPRMRLGVALLLPEPLRSEVDGLRRGLGDGSLERIAPHITLVPPVNVPTERLGEVLALLRRTACEHRPFDVELGPVSTFAPDSPVLYLALSRGRKEVASLRDGVFSGPLSRSLSWPFVPHVTICEEVSDDKSAAGLSVLSAYRASFSVEGIHLLVEEQRVWRPLADVSLGGVRVVGRGGLELEISQSERLDPEASVLLASCPRRAETPEEGRPESHRSGFAFAARREGVVQGVAVGVVHEGVARVSALRVAPDARRQGIGSHLIASVAALVAQTPEGEGGGARIELSARRAEARAFLSARGFVAFEDDVASRWVMSRAL